MPIREELKLEVGKKYRTRNGCEVEILKVNLKDKEYPVLGVADRGKGEEVIEYFTSEGLFYLDKEESNYDIISEIKPKKVLWVNVYPAGSASADVFSTRRDADLNTKEWRRLACIRVEYEEGQFDE